MKKITTTIAAALFAVTLFAGNGDGEKNNLKVNSEKSKVFWTGKKVTGEHMGTLMLTGGTIELTDGLPSTGMINLDMTSIVVTDIEDEGTNAKLVGHLNSPDFFSVSDYPEGNFNITSFQPIDGATGDDANYNVIGTLTLKGITEEVSFPAFISVKKNKLVANGKLTLDRTKWDIKYGSGSFFEGLGDKVIYDDIELNFVLSAEV